MRLPAAQSLTSPIARIRVVSGHPIIAPGARAPGYAHFFTPGLQRLALTRGSFGSHRALAGPSKRPSH